MTPLRSGERSSRDWQHINDLAGNARYSRDQVINLRHQVTALQEPALDAAFMFPFRIYSFPICWRAAGNYTTDWLKFRVHAGRYMGVIVTGTDCADVDPGGTNYPTAMADADAPPKESDVTDIAIPAGTQQFWFWIDVSNAAIPVIKYGFTGSSAGAGAGGDPVLQGWTTFPTADGSHAPVGWVDVLTHATDSSAIIRQLIRTDVIAGGGSGATWLP
jgi:hypothetical protein